MTDDTKRNNPPGQGSLPAADLPPQRLKKVEVEHHEQAPRRPPGRQIHPRRPAPPVPPGEENPDRDPSPAAGIVWPPRRPRGT